MCVSFLSNFWRLRCIQTDTSHHRRSFSDCAVYNIQILLHYNNDLLNGLYLVDAERRIQLSAVNGPARIMVTRGQLTSESSSISHSSHPIDKDNLPTYE